MGMGSDGTRKRIWLLTAACSLGYMGFLWFLFTNPARSDSANVMSISFMDEHMIVGGEYFNVLRGTYEIEDLGGGECLLKLTSDHVAISHVNFYADSWGRILMRDIQNRILEVIRKRCESSGQGA
jgi:hypothetical protein